MTYLKGGKMDFKCINVCDCRKKGCVSISGKGSNCIVETTSDGLCKLCLHYVQVRKVPIDWEPYWGLLDSFDYKQMKGMKYTCL